MHQPGPTPTRTAQARMISRRTLLGGLAATVAVATVGRPAASAARTGSLDARDGYRSGFRAMARARLATLEATAGLAPLTDPDRFRGQTHDRLVRLEELRGLQTPGRDGLRWRDWVSDRLVPLESFLPTALRFPFYTHLPVDTSAAQHGPLLRKRIAEGSCNGIFLYAGAGTPLAPTAVLDSITSSGGPVPILMSPKNVSDPAKLAGWMQYWADRPEWVPYVRVAFWQEPQGDFGGPGQPPVTKYHEGVRILADAADKVGIASVAHVETWHLHPDYQPDGGVPRLLELLQPVVHRLGGGISWSVFVFNRKPGAANNYVRWMDEFMAEHLTYTTYGVAAYGDAVDPALPPEHPDRTARAARVASMFVDLDASRARWGGYYALPVGPDPRRNFWDGIVREKTEEAVDDLADGGRTLELRLRDRAVHLATPD